MTRKIVIILLVIFAVSIGLRLARVDREFLGNFGQRQVYNAWVVRNFVKEGINIQDSKMDLQDYEGKKIPCFRDFPLVIPSVAFCVRNFGGSIEFWSRFSSVFFYALTFIVLFFWLRMYFKPPTLTFILFVFAFSPMSIVYSQSFILEVSALFFFCLGMLLLEKYFSHRNMFLLLAGSLLIGTSFASRTQYAILIIPVIYLFLREHRVKCFKNPSFYITLFFIFMVPLTWQVTAWKMAALNSSKSSLDITFRTYLAGGKFFIDPIYYNLDLYKKLFDDLTGIIFNPMGFSLAVLGIVIWKWKEKNNLFPIYFLSMILAVVLVPRKFYRHDYYFFPILVPGSVFAGYFLGRLYEKLDLKLVVMVLLLIFMAASFRHSLHPAFKTPDVEKPYIQQTEIVKEIVPENSKIVVVGATPPFLYYCDRMGWDLSLEKSKESRRSTGFVLSGGRLPDDPVERLKYYESLGAEYVIAYDPALLEENKELISYIQNNYVPVKNTVYMTIFKKKNR